MEDQRGPPILKLASQSGPQNYLPKVLLWEVSKVMEGLIDNAPTTFLADSQLHGTDSEDADCAKNESGSVGRRVKLTIISRDFSEAFDRVSCPGL